MMKFYAFSKIDIKKKPTNDDLWEGGALEQRKTVTEIFLLDVGECIVM